MGKLIENTSKCKLYKITKAFVSRGNKCPKKLIPKDWFIYENMLPQAGYEKSEIKRLLLSEGRLIEVKEYDGAKLITNNWLQQDIEFANPVNEVEELKLRNYRDFEKIRKEKNFLIEGIIPPRTLTMIYGLPGCFKSIIVIFMAMCIASGKNFLKYKTKKSGIIISDKENSDQLIKERLNCIRKGLNIRSKNFPLFYLHKQDGQLSQDFLNKLNETVKKNNIKLIILDTLHRHSNYNENSADDINEMYTTYLSPLMEESNVSIIFLHHTSKAGGYRGSIDLEGISDLVFKVKRNSKTEYFELINEKNRMGEISPIKARLVFEDEEIFLEQSKFVAKEEFISKQKELENEILCVFNGTSQLLKFRDIKNKLEKKKVDFNISTLKRALSSLKDSKLKMNGRKGYSLIKQAGAGLDISEEVIE